MTWNCLSGLTWARIALYPPGLTASPWQASVIKAYGSLSSGWWIKGIRIVFNSQYAFSAYSCRGSAFQGHSRLFSSVRGAVSWAKFCTCDLKKLHSPRNCLTSATSFRRLSSGNSLQVICSGWTPSWLILNPKYSTSGKQNIDLGKLIFNPSFLSQMNNWYKIFSCCSWFLVCTNISLMWAFTFLSWWMTISNNFWKDPGAPINPAGKAFHSNWPRPGNVNAVYFLYSGFKNICQNPEVKSIFENNLDPALLRSSMMSCKFFIE